MNQLIVGELLDADFPSMPKADRKRVQLALCGLVQTLAPDMVLSIETQRGYLMALQDLGADGIEAACALAARNWKPGYGRKFPAPVELRELVEGTVYERAAAAWELVAEAMERHGAHNSVAFADPRISRAIARCGGWVLFCEKPDVWAQRDFLAAYQILLGQSNVQPVRLPGLWENRGDPFKVRHIGGQSVPKLGSRDPAVTGLATRLQKRL